MSRSMPCWGGHAFSQGHCRYHPLHFSLSSPPSPPPFLQTQHGPEGEPYEAEDFVCDYHLEMLSLSQDQQNPSCIQFDDSNWQLHLTSLKPLGLNVLLNLCDASVTERLCRFSDHLCNVALQESRSAVLPVRVPWGLCELARLIGRLPGDSSGAGPPGPGVALVKSTWQPFALPAPLSASCLFIHPSTHPTGFTPGAKELFKQGNHLALYRLPSAETMKETSLGRLSCVTKRRPPLSHMISLFIKDTTTCEPPGSMAGRVSFYGALDPP